MDKKQVEDLCKQIHLNNAKLYFETKEFEQWVNECYALHVELQNNTNV